MSRTTLRPALAALSLVAALFAAVVAPAGPASAAAYRYWGYYQLNGSTWQFSTKGADQTKPADGAVEGWRFAVAGETDTRAPRVTTTFEEVCGQTPEASGKKRVAVVIDYGRPADAEGGATPPVPVAECASVASAATGAEVVAAVATMRAEGGLICAIDGYPAAGCGGEVKQVSAEAAAPDTPTTLASPAGTVTDTATGSAAASSAAAASAASENDASGTNALWYVAVVVFLAAAAAALFLAMRRRGEH